MYSDTTVMNYKLINVTNELQTGKCVVYIIIKIIIRDATS
jgi:hypothetical protein